MGVEKLWTEAPVTIQYYSSNLTMSSLNKFISAYLHPTMLLDSKLRNEKDL